MRTANAGILEFARAVWGDYWARMSGPASVPAAILALWLSNDVAKTGFALTAFVCAWITAYRVWKPEREKNIATDARPVLRPSFGMNDPTCVHRNLILREVTSTRTVVTKRCDWYRVRVDATGGNISGCQARLMSVKRAQSELIPGDFPPLPIVHADGNPKTIHQGVSDHVDLLFILENNTVQSCVPLERRSLSVDWNNMFSLAGDYNITVAITSPEAETASIELIFRWTLDRATSEIVWLARQ